MGLVFEREDEHLAVPAILPSPLKGLAAVLILLRPSNEALLRARVPGAENRHSCQAFLALSPSTQNRER